MWLWLGLLWSRCDMLYAVTSVGGSVITERYIAKILIENRALFLKCRLFQRTVSNDNHVVILVEVER